jgi:hypothetical protein
MTRGVLEGALLSLGVLAWTACGPSGGNSEPPGCSPGATHACLMPGGCRGPQVCASDGKSFGPCDCGANNGVAGTGGSIPGTADAGRTVDSSVAVFDGSEQDASLVLASSTQLIISSVAVSDGSAHDASEVGDARTGGTLCGTGLTCYGGSQCCGELGMACDNGQICNAGLECAAFDAQATCRCPAGNCSATLLASAHDAQSLTVDRNFVYWSDYGPGEVRRVPVGGGPAETLDVVGGGGEWVSGLAVTGSNIYFACNGDVCSMPLDGVLDGGTVADLGRVVSGSSTPTALAVAVGPTGVYASSIVAGGTGNWITKFPRNGGAPLAIGGIGPQLPTRVLVDTSYVYWSDRNSVVAAPLDGGATIQLGTVDAVQSYASRNVLVPLAADDLYVYTSNGGEIIRVPKPGNTAGTMSTVQRAQAGGITAIGVDSTRVFWGETDYGLHGYVYVAPLSGGGPTLIASNGNGGLGGVDEIFDLVLDSTHIYWTTGYQIFSLAK